jgi:hypothetical protein
MSSSPNRSERARPTDGVAGVRDRLGGFFAKAASRASEGADRLRGPAASILQHAQAARARRNLEAAFWLLDEASRNEPDDREVQRSFWEVAVALGRAPAAREAGVALVEASAAAGDPDDAARHFVELSEQVPEARISPAAVARMLPPLSARMAGAAEGEAAGARELARLALHHALHRSEDGGPVLTPGLAFHLFKDARKIDPDAARRIAEIALSSSDLHEVKRSKLERFLAGEDPATGEPLLEVDENEASHPALEVDDEPEAPIEVDVALASEEESPEIDAGAVPKDIEAHIDSHFALAFDVPVDHEEPVLPPLSREEIADAARRLEGRHGALSTESVPRPDPASLKVLRAVPTGFDEQALALRLPGGRRSRVGWKEIQALSVARLIGGAESQTVIVDCILNWRRRQHETLRIVRLYMDDFEPSKFVRVATPDLPAFLTELFERCQASPLPDPESALGVRIAEFENLACYQREVLGA